MKLKNLRYKILALLAIIATGVWWVEITNTEKTFAEDAPKTSLFVSPMVQKIIVTPGEIYSGSITVTNSSASDSDFKYVASIGSYTLATDGDINRNRDNYGSTDVNTITNHNIITQWVSLDKKEGTLSPNAQDVINYTIRVPKDAPAGAQYFSILVSDNTDLEIKHDDATDKTSAGIANKYQLASAIFANVAGETVEKGSISENNMPSVLTTNKLEATSMVRNDGNIYTDATYTLQVWPLTSDEELCTNEEKAETSMILPNTERYHVQTCELPAVGIFRAKQVVKIFGEESVLEKTIFVCPIWLMILAIVIVVAIVITIVVMVRKRKKSASQD